MKRIEDMSDDEIAGLSADQVVALSNEQSNTGEDRQEQEEVVVPAVEAQNEVLNAEDDKADEVAAAAAKADDEDKAEREAQAAAEAAANGAEAGKPVDESNGKDKPATEVKADKAPAKAAAKDKPTDEKPADAGTPVVAPVVPTDLTKFYAEITKPFKANGREIKVESVEEVRQLMSMGANYNKKMQGMKPHLATLRTLENAKIGEAELNFLIDLHNGVPEAINKLVKDRGIDPLDIAPEKAAGYTPTNHKASDAEVELDSVLADLEGSEALPKTLDLVAKKWDKASKQFIGSNPQILKVINSHIESGIYDQISAEVDRQRMLGQLSGLSDLAAYRQVGDALNESGKFATQSEKAGQPTTPVQQAPAAPVVQAPDPKKADDGKRNDAKRAVAPVKSVAPTAAIAPDFNPLSLSDEDFAKQFGGKF